MSIAEQPFVSICDRCGRQQPDCLLSEQRFRKCPGPGPHVLCAACRYELNAGRKDRTRAKSRKSSG